MVGPWLPFLLSPFKLSIVCKKIIELRFLNFVSSGKSFFRQNNSFIKILKDEREVREQRSI